ncbi:unnamed protein product [Ixodes persulcatus]
MGHLLLEVQLGVRPELRGSFQQHHLRPGQLRHAVKRTPAAGKKSGGLSKDRSESVQRLPLRPRLRLAEGGEGGRQLHATRGDLQRAHEVLQLRTGRLQRRTPPPRGAILDPRAGRCGDGCRRRLCLAAGLQITRRAASVSESYPLPVYCPSSVVPSAHFRGSVQYGGTMQPRRSTSRYGARRP